jgi:hypothetical protein
MPGRPALGRVLALAAPLLLLCTLVAHANELSDARRLLRSDGAKQRLEAIHSLVALDDARAVPPLEEALRRTRKTMEALAKEEDEADKFLGHAYGLLQVASSPGSGMSLSRAKEFVRTAQADWNRSAQRIRAHLSVREAIGDALRRFRSPGALDRIEAGARDEQYPFSPSRSLEAASASQGAYRGRIKW